MRTYQAGALVLSSILTAASLPASGEQPAPKPAAPPVDIGLSEKVGRRLIQLDVTVEGPDDVIAALTAEDFEIDVGGQAIRELLVDRRCLPLEGDVAGSVPNGPVPGGDVRPGVAGPSRAAAASFLFYFDQHHLTPEGRLRSIALARELVETLLQGGNRASIVSAGQTLRTLASWTGDRSRLLAALDELERDPAQADPYPGQEDARVQDVQDRLAATMDAATASTHGDLMQLRGLLKRGQRRPEGLVRPISSMDRSDPADELIQQIAEAREGAVRQTRDLALQYQRDEHARTERALAQFSVTLDRMLDVPFPKAALYFADTMRARAGAHYLALLRTQNRDRRPRQDSTGAHLETIVDPESIEPVPAYERVIGEANARGIRLYTVAAQGLVATPAVNPSSSMLLTRMLESPGPLGAQARFAEAEDSLGGLAAETGGRTFLRGAPAAQIAREVLRDVTCLYVVSFDPGSLAQDRRLPVLVQVRRPHVRVRSRASLVVQSESALRESRLLAAFVAPGDAQAGPRASGAVIPTGFDHGRFSALVQVAVRGSAGSAAEWELGFSLVSRGEVVKQASGKITIRGASVPLVFESEARLEPGPWELSVVARETRTDVIATGHFGGDWPDPRDRPATVGPFVLLQPTYGAFLRDADVRRQGPLGADAGSVIDADRPAALVGIVCRDRSARGLLRVDRRLAGDGFADFPSIEFDPSSDACAVVRDVIPQGVMTSGTFQYEVRVRDESQEIASGGLEFAALKAGSP